MKNLSKTLILLAIVAVFGLSPLVVRAIESTGDSPTSSEETDTSTDNQTNNRADVQSRIDALREKNTALKEQAKERAVARLEGKKLEVCQNRQEKIQNIFVNITDRSKGHYDQISNAYTRVTAFHDLKELAIDGYNDLILEIDADKALAMEATLAIRNQKPQFDCGGDNPKAQAEEYKTLVKNNISALLTYRDSVRELIDLIKTNLPTTEVTPNEN